MGSVDRGDTPAPMPRQLERDARNALDFFTAVDFGIERMIPFGAAGRTEINAAQQFPDNDEIDTSNRVPPQRRTVDQCLIDGHGTKVRVISEKFPQIQQSVFALLPRRKVIVFGITYSAEENGIGLEAEVLCDFRQRLTMTLYRNAADVPFDEFELVIVLARNDF